MLVGSDGREINGNGVDLTERQKAKVMKQNATIEDVNEIAHAHAVQATNHLGNQIPPLIHKIVGEAIQGFYESLKERGMLNAPDDSRFWEPPKTVPPKTVTVDKIPEGCDATATLKGWADK